MENALAVDILNSSANLQKQFVHFFFIVFLFLHKISNGPAWCVLHDQVDFSILYKVLEQLDHIRMSKLDVLLGLVDHTASLLISQKVQINLKISTLFRIAGKQNIDQTSSKIKGFKFQKAPSALVIAKFLITYFLHGKQFTSLQISNKFDLRKRPSPQKCSVVPVLGIEVV